MSRIKLFFLLGLLPLFPPGLPGAENVPANTLPKFEEFYPLLKKELKTLTAEQIDQAAVRGLLQELQNQVYIATNLSSNEIVTSGPMISKKDIYDAAYGYLRLKRLGSEVDKEFSSAFQSLSSSNKLKGLVIDLRFAEGTNYQAAAEMVSLFLGTPQILMEMGSETYRSKPTTNAIDIPVTVLMNHQTRGAPEALAALLRQTQVALLLGTVTAGQIGIFQDFSLSNGQKIKLLAQPVRFAAGSNTFVQGIKPDIEIPVSPEEERIYFEDPYRMIPRLAMNSISGGSVTNRTQRRRINEAELVRLQREINAEGNSTPEKTILDSGLVINDPALARALDLLKGLSVVRKLQTK